MSLQGYWADKKTTQLRDVPTDLVAVLPIGAIEQHGPHLPLSVDCDLVNAVIVRMLAQLADNQNVLVMPSLTITKSEEHNRFAGTLSLSADTLLSVLRDVGRSVSSAGITRLVLFNGHGGNNAVLEIAARDLRLHHNMVVATCSWFGFATIPSEMDQTSIDFDLHAGELETSAMLASRPELVDMSATQNFRPVMEKWKDTFQYIGLTGQPARPGWAIEDLNEFGACGNAREATAEKGEQLLNSAASGFVEFLKEFAVFDHRGTLT